MEIAYVLRDLWRLRVAVAVIALLAIVAGAATSFRISVLPPGLENKSFEIGAASTQMMVDSPKSSLGDLHSEFDPLTSRAGVFAQFMASPPVRASVARRLGVPADAIVATAATDMTQLTRSAQEPTAEERSAELVAEGRQFRLYFEAQPELPVVSVYAQAKTAEQAVKLANGAVAGLKRFVERTQLEQGVRPAARVRVAQLGPAKGGVVNPGVNKIVAVMAFFAVLIGGCLALLVVVRIMQNVRQANALESAVAPDRVLLDFKPYNAD